MAWSGSSARFRDYSISPTVDIGYDFLTLPSLCLPGPSGLSECPSAEECERQDQHQNDEAIHKFEVKFHRISPGCHVTASFGGSQLAPLVLCTLAVGQLLTIWQ